MLVLALALPLTLLTNLIRNCEVVSISDPGEWDHSCCCFRNLTVYKQTASLGRIIKKILLFRRYSASLKLVKGWAA